MPPATLDAFRDHGRIRPTLTENVEEAIRILDLAAEAGISFKELTDKLLVDGLKQFGDAFDKLLEATDHSGKASDHDPMDSLRVKLLKEIYEGQHHP